MGLSGGLATNGTSGGGSGGVSSAAVAWAQREQAKLAALGLSGQTFDIFSGPTLSANALTSQQVWGQMAGLLAGDVVTNIWVLTNAAGVGIAPSNMFLGLYTTGGTRLAQTADVAGSANWTGTPGFVSFALASPFTVTVTGGYYFAVLQNGTWGTTAVKLEGGVSNALIAEHSPSGVSPTVIQNTQATLPATAAFTSAGPTMTWFGWS